MLRITLTALLINSFQFVCAQIQQEFVPSVFIRTNPTSFLDRDGGLTLGVGYHFEKRFGVTFDPTYIFYNFFSGWMDRSESKKGIKIRADLRYYGKRPEGSKNFFIGPEFHYKYVKNKRWVTFGMDCIQGNCAYFKYASYTQTVRELGVSLKGGIEILSANRRWSAELFAGLGFRYLTFKEKDIPPGGSFSFPPDRPVLLGQHRAGVAYPIIPGGIKFGYRIH